MTKQVDVTIPMDRVLGGRLRGDRTPREVEVLTEEIKEGNFLIRLKFEPRDLIRTFWSDELDDEFAFAGGMGMTD